MGIITNCSYFAVSKLFAYEEIDRQRTSNHGSTVGKRASLDPRHHAPSA